MAGTTGEGKFDEARIILGLLDSVERNGGQSQRHLASELGIALGLVNAYLKRCMKKGLVKASQAPARRYVYYLTPQGFAEKSRLTVEYLSSSFSFFRQARADCAAALVSARSRGWQRIALLGVSDLAEIATICALESGITIIAIVDAKSVLSGFVSLPVVKVIDGIGEVDAVMVTDLKAPQQIAEEAARRLGAQRVLVPALLGVRLDAEKASGEEAMGT